MTILLNIKIIFFSPFDSTKPYIWMDCYFDQEKEKEALKELLLLLLLEKAEEEFFMKFFFF